MLVPALGLGAREEHRHRHSIKRVTAADLKFGVDLISDVLPFGRLWYIYVSHAIVGEIYSRSHDAAIRV